jgi:hypothetical protein
MISQSRAERSPTSLTAVGLEKWTATAIIALLVAGCTWTPSDASIIARFNAQRAEFNRLLEMFHQDGIEGRIGCDGPPDDAQRDPQPLSAQRRVEYTKIFKSIGCDGAAYYYSGNGRAQFMLWSVGMLWAGQDKSIVFIPGAPPARVVATTDHYQWTQRDHVQGAVELYHHIDGPWYLQYIAN